MSKEKFEWELTPKKTLPVIVLAGPTASGKTALSLALAARLPRAEIVSADSLQFYRGMDIGTAKIPYGARQTIPHHLIDIVDPKYPLTVTDFCCYADDIIQKIHARQAIPIVVGGSGFYLQTFLYGPPSGPPSEPALRKKLESQAELLGIDLLYQKLKDLDPTYAATITCRDRQKVIRALEVIQITARPVSSFEWKERRLRSCYAFFAWALVRSRATLRERVETRCDQMVQEGLLEEVRQLDQEGLRSNSSASHAIGYRHALEYLDSPQTAHDYLTFINTFKQDSCRLIKKQLTWFKREQALSWLDLDILSEEDAIQTILSSLPCR